MIKRPDNLRPEGNFAQKERINWAPRKKASILKRDDNLRMEGSIEMTKMHTMNKANSKI